MAKRILIADDYALVRKALRQILEAGGRCEILEAANGEDAVAKTRELKPDLVILDLAMPQMDGIRAARIIAGEFPNTPIIVHTLHTSPRLRLEAMKAGVRKFIPKSDSATVLAAVRELLGEDFSAKRAERANNLIPTENLGREESSSAKPDSGKVKKPSRRAGDASGPAD